MAKEKEINEIPASFDPDREEIKYLKALKRKAAKSFSFTRMEALFKMKELAYALYAFRRTGECLEVCQTAARVEFSGNFNLWSPVETTLALYARMLKEKGETTAADTVMARVRKAGFVNARLMGELLKDKEIREAIADGSITDERDWRLRQLSELCFMKELGGSAEYPVDRIETLFQENLAALRELLKTG